MSKDTEWGPWIGWNGGECPVDGDAVVQCFCDEGERFYDEHFADELDWSTGGAYRVKKEPVIDVDSRAVTFSLRETAFIAYATCTYRDGKLISIKWEAPDA